MNTINSPIIADVQFQRCCGLERVDSRCAVKRILLPSPHVIG